MRKTVLFALLMLLSVKFCLADGGMWLPVLVEKYIKDMKANGFKLDAEDIYSINQACMKDAVLQFGGGCTGEIVSDKGLLFTNHHCGRGEIQSHSTLEHDYLTDGFWALSLEEELPCKDLSISILQAMVEVPAGVDIDDASSKKNFLQKYIAEYGESLSYSFESFYGGNVHYLFISKIFTDVRLVGAPPSSVGSFGGDTDNWMWPRHGGDFSVFRIYADKDNNPHDYSPFNVPYKPKQHFKISLKGVQEGDFTMVFGYPGTTEEYLPSCAVDAKQNVLMPARVFARQNIMDIMEEAIDASRAVRLKYSSRYAGVENAKKKWEGSILGLRRFDAIGKKIEFEKEFTAKVNESLQTRGKYGNVLSDYQKAYADGLEYMKADAYFLECIYQLMQCKIGAKGYNLSNIDGNLTPPQIKGEASKKLGEILSLYSQRDSVLERKLFKRMFRLYADSCAAFMPDTFKTIFDKNGIRTPEEFVDYYYANSLLADTVKLKELVNKSTGNTSLSESKWNKSFAMLHNTLSKDIGVVFYYEMIKMYFDKVAPSLNASFTAIGQLDKKYQEALLKLMPEKIKFPDANSTLRFTYGKVKGYEPRDGVSYKHFTTLDGVIEKDNPEIYDYHVPAKLKSLYKNKDFGSYADKDGSVHVCFIAGNHTTGGNSGSPVVNADGELIGINFDRCWEGTMSDIMYNPEICRNISVDIRYVLFLIDKLGGASNIIAELDIVK